MELGEDALDDGDPFAGIHIKNEVGKLGSWEVGKLGS